jgi:hypothetical protein
MERYVAIDNVCAWPNLTKMPEGAIVATIFNQPCHGLWEGDVECWASEDGGRLWQLRGTPAPHEPGTNRMNVAAGLAANGDLVVITSGWTHRPGKGEGSVGHGAPAHPLLPWVCRSGDGGRTWTQAETMPPPEAVPSPEAVSIPIIPFGDVVRLQDGTLGVCIYSWRPPDEHSCCFYASADDGRTWSDPKCLVALEPADLGYPATVLGNDGALLTAWYCSGIAAHQRYHMGAVVWAIDKLFTLER